MRSWVTGTRRVPGTPEGPGLIPGTQEGSGWIKVGHKIWWQVRDLHCRVSICRMGIPPLNKLSGICAILTKSAKCSRKQLVKKRKETKQMVQNLCCECLKTFIKCLKTIFVILHFGGIFVIFTFWWNIYKFYMETKLRHEIADEG